MCKDIVDECHVTLCLWHCRELYTQPLTEIVSSLSSHFLSSFQINSKTFGVQRLQQNIYDASFLQVDSSPRVHTQLSPLVRRQVKTHLHNIKMSRGSHIQGHRP